MRTDTSSMRTPGLSATTTLVALMAMATTCSAIAVPKVGHAPTESRSLMTENQSVRHVAAAVAALARDIFGNDHVEAALTELPWTKQYLPIIESQVSASPYIGHVPVPPLIEQMLDLPPPVC